MIEFSSVLPTEQVLCGEGRQHGVREDEGDKVSKMLGFEFAELVHFRRVAPPGKTRNAACTRLGTVEGSHWRRDGIRMPSRG